MQPQSISTQEEYKILVEQCLFLVNSEVKKAESYRDSGNHSDLASRLAVLISLVNFIGYLRGQDNVFLDTRPPFDFQKDLYEQEILFENRLVALIEYVNQSPSAEKAKFVVSQYYMKNRHLE